MGESLKRLEGLVREVECREELLVGSLYVRRRRCGRKGCRCEHGGLHESQAFSVTEKGRTRHHALGALDEVRLRRAVEEYRRFRRARRRIRNACGELRRQVEEMAVLRGVSVEEFRVGAKERREEKQ